MLEKIERYQELISGMEEELDQVPEVKELLEELLQDLNDTVRQNHALRRTILKNSSKESRMSTKLRDALYE
ncbi:hypothetical protein [Paenibacillus sp.]|jgi:predicted DNA binding CopG/RHH family protein|uniref:hypothetical protein n=1 Tax=Paenibacillus sp. TaxID=58172 RepID=UPI00283834B0|nr:hypothetical protein [Paenibacillus sp.]MDR0266577.1 hypothetical protein [Paenibacillus sp.]